MADLTDLVAPPDWHNPTRSTPSSPGSITRGSDIESIRQNIIDEVSTGILKPNRFEVFISGLDPSVFSDRFNMSCETVSFPGRSVSTQPARVYGPIREMPYERLYTGDLDVTFRMGRDMLERNFFEQWMDRIASKTSNDFKYHGTNESGYAKSMKINQLDKNNNVVYSILVREVFPKAVNTIELDHSKTDEYLKQIVSFAFRDYVVEYAECQQTQPSSRVQREPGQMSGLHPPFSFPASQNNRDLPREPHNGYERLW
jgi:hypothetical protein